MGVMSPFSVATAIAIWIESRGRGPSSDQVTFTSGISCNQNVEGQFIGNKDRDVVHPNKETYIIKVFKLSEQKVIVNSTYFKCDSSCLDNEIIDRYFNLF